MAPTARDEVIHSASSIAPSSYYHANRNGLSTLTHRDREPKSSSDYYTSSYSKPPLASSVTITGNAIVDHIRQQDRMRAHRDANSSGRSSTSSLDRVGLTSPSSASSAAYSSADSSYGRSRPILGPTRAYASYSSPAGGRSSILESTDVLRPVTTAGAGYSRNGSYSRTPSDFSDRESLYDYGSRSGSVSRSGYSRESSVERPRDVNRTGTGRFSRKPADSEDEDSVSVTGSIKLRPASSTAGSKASLPPISPHPSSLSRQTSNGYSSRPSSSASYYQPLQRSDSRSSLTGGRDSGIPVSVSNGGLSRLNSNASSLGSRGYSRTGSRDASVSFDLSNVSKRDPSPAVLVSRVAVERDIPIHVEREDAVESRYVVSKFPVEISDDLSRNVPVASAPHRVRERDASLDRSRPAVRITRGRDTNGNYDYYEPMQENGYDGGYKRTESRERVIGGKKFASDSSLGTSSGSDDDITTTSKYPNSIIRAGSPPTPRRTVTLGRKTSSISVDESDKAGLIGLKNLGNTCFMNSILQCLSNTRPLRDYCLQTSEFESEVNTTTSQMKGTLISAFAAMLEAVWKRISSYSTTTPYVPDRFHRQVQQYAPRFSGYLQQDAQEFLRYLLEGLHEDVNRVKEKQSAEKDDIPEHLSDAQKASESWKRYLKRDNSKVVDLFVGQLKSSLICESCGYCSVTYDPFWDLSLPIPGSRSRSTYASPPSTSIEECFKLFTREEMLDGEESPTCCHCKTKQRCRKFFTIQRFPKYLVIHLKRFSQERFRAKLSTMVEYPVDGLDLSAFAADTQVGPRPYYNLYGVVGHSGSTHCGHYIAYCKHPVTGKWNEYNDARVAPAKVDDVVTSEAYLLFYELAS